MGSAAEVSDRIKYKGELHDVGLTIVVAASKPYACGHYLALPVACCDVVTDLFDAVRCHRHVGGGEGGGGGEWGTIQTY